ncbi:MAG: metal-dependent hydrolase [Candidatus Sericytochromatia bacterium]|nr:metal-dependent hydrolase [Candidatus Sericytochromatia bacterium]
MRLPLALATLAASVLLGAAPAQAWTLTWLGHAGWVVESRGGTRLLIDPWLANPRFPRGYALPARVDAVLVSHGHSDHAESAAELSERHKAPIVGCYELVAALAPEAGPAGIGANIGGAVKVGDVTVHLTAAAHSSAIVQEGATPHYTGAPVGFVLMAPGERPLYHAGDTGLTREMETIRELYQPGIALLPIGGHFTMDPVQAAIASRWLGVKDVVPMHHGTFPVLSGKPTALRAALSRAVRMTDPVPGTAFKL